MTMKRYLLLVMAAMVMAVSCGKEFDDSKIWESIEALKTRVAALEQKVADNVTAIQSMISLGSVSSCEYDAETGKAVITLIGGKTITVNLSVKGYSLITVMQGEDGNYYWAICKDGVSVPLEINGKMVPVTVTPALKISDQNEWQISVDGGKTWTNTGISYLEGTQGGDGQDQVRFFKDVKQEDGCLILTLADGTPVKVAVVGEATFKAAAETLWFSRAEMEKSVAVEMVSVKAFTITEKPEGWNARMDEGYLYVTAPENFEEYPAQGTVKALAVFEGGVNPAILSLEVVYEPMFTLSYTNGKVAVKLSEHTAEDFNGYVLEGWKKADFSVEKAVAWLDSEAASHVPYSGTAEYALSEIIDSYVETEDYVVFAAPYLPAVQVAQGKMAYTAEDVQNVVLKGVTAAWTFSDVRFDSAVFTAEMDGPFYGGFFKYEDWNNYARDNFLETLETGGATPYDIPSFSGPANCFPDGEVKMNINPATEYVIWYLPEKTSGTYVAEDFLTYTVKTPDVTYDASIAAPAYVVKNVTVSGFTADVTPAAGAYKTYAAILKSSVIPETEIELVRYVISLNKFSSGQAVNTVTNSSLSAEDESYLVAVSLTEDGRYGNVVKVKQEVAELVVTEDLGVEVTGIDYGMGDVTLSLGFKGDPASITYMAATYTYYSDADMQKLMALGQMGEAKTVEVSKLGGQVYLNGLTLGAEHTFYAVVRDSGNKSSALYKYKFTPKNEIDYLLSIDEDYEYGMPQISGTVSGNTYTMNVDMPATCVKYWLFKGDAEYFTGDPYTDSDKLVTGALDLSGATVHTESISEVKYTSMYKAYSRIYMVWLDDQGRYHAIYEFNPYKS